MNILFIIFLGLVLSSCKTVEPKKIDYIADNRSNYEGNSTQSQILRRSQNWNVGWVSRDLSKVFEIFANDAQFTSAGGKWSGKEEGMRKFENLLKNRPDLQWVIRPKEIIVNEDWQVAHATGDWSEWWTEPNKEMVTLHGTFAFIWKRTKNEPWLIHSAIFTPLRCLGGKYCEPHDK